MSEDALDLLYALRLPDDTLWGEVATPFQKEDAAAILLNKRPDPTWHFLTRPRGGSKTTDLAAIALAWLAIDAPPLANGHVVAAKAEQANILIDAIKGFYARTPELQSILEPPENSKVVSHNEAWFRVLATSDSGAWGLRDAHILICDEFCQWPTTRKAERVWEAIVSTAQKVDNCKLVIISSAGEPSHWSYPIWKRSKTSKLWRSHDLPGPVPWQRPEELDELQHILSPSAYRRLILNEWCESEDRPITEDDYDACTGNYHSQVPNPEYQYVVGIDIGLVNDASVVVIGHAVYERPHDYTSRPHIVVDHVQRWKGTRKKPVRLSYIEDWLLANMGDWFYPSIYADPTQFKGSIERLQDKGLNIKPWEFTTMSVGKVARALTQVFRNHQITVPNIAELKEELLNLRLKDNSAGVTRLDTLPGKHDDQAVCIGMISSILLDLSNGLGAQWMTWMEHEQANPSMPNHRSPYSLYEGEAKMIYNEVVSNIWHMSCEHRWRDGYCLLCHHTMEPETIQK
ncbi:MAG: terminase large subunit [Candidatus Parvarchaeum sp.]